MGSARIATYVIIAALSIAVGVVVCLMLDVTLGFAVPIAFMAAMGMALAVWAGNPNRSKA